MSKGEEKDKKRPSCNLPDDDLSPEKKLKLEDAEAENNSEKLVALPSADSEDRNAVQTNEDNGNGDRMANEEMKDDSVPSLEHPSGLLIKYHNVPMISMDENTDFAVQFNVAEYGLGNYEISRIQVGDDDNGVTWSFTTPDGKKGYIKCLKGNHIDEEVTQELHVKVQNGVMKITVTVEVYNGRHEMLMDLHGKAQELDDDDEEDDEDESGEDDDDEDISGEHYGPDEEEFNSDDEDWI